MKRISLGLLGLFIATNAFAADAVTTLTLKCAKAPPAAYLKTIGDAIALTAKNSIEEAGATETRIRVSFKSKLTSEQTKVVEASDITQDLVITVGSDQQQGTVTINGTKGSFQDDCRYEVKVNVAVAGKDSEGIKFVKRTLSTVRLSAPRQTVVRRTTTLPPAAN